MSAFKDHFSSHPAGYAAYRPTYPAALVDLLADLARENRLAVDIACGTGQLSVPLARRFDRVLALDGSAPQIAAAQPHPRVEYRVALAEDTGIDAVSADLITVAQAAHWFDLNRFYPEVRRIGRPGAVLALITYGRLEMDVDLMRIVHAFRTDVVDAYWPPGREHVDNGYRLLPFPFTERPTPLVTLEQSWTLGEFIGYVDTWSAVRAAEKAVGRAPLDAFAGALGAHWGAPESRRTIRWPLSMRVARL